METVNTAPAAAPTIKEQAAAAWDSTKQFATRSEVKDIAVLAAKTSLCTLVALGTIKAVGAIANAL